MRLSDHQWLFLRHLAKLTDFADLHGYKLTGGELWRPQFTQDHYVESGISWTKVNRHGNRLAQDYNIFKWNRVTKKWYAITELDEVRMLGDYWETMDVHNVAGMFWKGKKMDCWHFQRQLTPRKVRI